MVRLLSNFVAMLPGCGLGLCFLHVACAGGRAADAPALAWKQLPALPDSLGVAAPFAGVAGGSLLVAGGANFPRGFPWQGGRKAWHDQVWLLDPSSARWRTVGTLPRPLAYGVAVNCHGGLICIGGSDQNRHWADVFELRWARGQLTTQGLPPLPIPLANAAGALVGDTVYVVGGATEPGEAAASRRVFSLDTSTRAAWQEMEPLPGPARILPVAATVGDSLYVIGGVALQKRDDGHSTRIYLRDAWRYRPGQGWKHLADAPKPIAGAPSPAPVRNGEILVLGGDDGSLVDFRPLEKHPGWPRVGLGYQPAQDRWQEVGELPAPRATVPCVEWQGRFVVPGGEIRPGVRSPEVWSIPAP